MSSVFFKIVSGEIPAFKVAEDENHLAFLDIFPLAYGHVLVIPKKEVDYIFDLSSDEYSALFRFARKVANAMDEVLVCKRIGLAVIGLEVPHAHIHLIPINEMKDVTFTNKVKCSKDEFEEIAEKIKNFL